MDRGEWAAQYPDTALVKLGGRSIYVLHNLKELDLDPAAAGIDVVCQEVASAENRDRQGRALLDPGSAGPRVSPCPLHSRRLS